MLRYYTNVISQASRALATTIAIVGMLLIGFGMLIMALPELFAFLASALFFIAGVGCAITAIKIFWTQHRVDRYSEEPTETQVYRHNVRVRTHDDSDV